MASSLGNVAAGPSLQSATRFWQPACPNPQGPAILLLPVLELLVVRLQRQALLPLLLGWTPAATGGD
ncbi:hypothetical protein TSOC_010362 [Tetrabaena socialis]|uniref:Uncharacterized protein n=1 Tax=Tetrabaena socialis TaxID=47790 RepID=A0A2J7ZTI6_9CHLO|nr:hypothetical protein TSOC_010362 [Tetrabaena socialis]|eukprot:PNH03568.1 hypothetical protein TSOC_010362 [Tetrabaena socialis]